MPVVKYTDTKGYKWATDVPEGTPYKEHKFGIRLGPPDLSRLGLEDEQHRALHNALVDSDLYNAPMLIGKRALLKQIFRQNHIPTHLLNVMIGVFQEAYYGEMGK